MSEWLQLKCNCRPHHQGSHMLHSVHTSTTAVQAILAKQGSVINRAHMDSTACCLFVQASVSHNSTQPYRRLHSRLSCMTAWYRLKVCEKVYCRLLYMLIHSTHTCVWWHQCSHTYMLADMGMFACSNTAYLQGWEKELPTHSALLYIYASPAWSEVSITAFWVVWKTLWMGIQKSIGCTQCGFFKSNLWRTALCDVCSGQSSIVQASWTHQDVLRSLRFFLQCQHLHCGQSLSGKSRTALKTSGLAIRNYNWYKYTN